MGEGEERDRERGRERISIMKTNKKIWTKTYIIIFLQFRQKKVFTTYKEKKESRRRAG